MRGSESCESKPGIVSSLSSVPPVWPRLRPLIIGTEMLGEPSSPAAASTGAMSSEVLSPTPPVECLSTVKVWSGAASKVSPEKRMARVRSAVSRSDRPRWKTAIRNEPSCASVMSLWMPSCSTTIRTNSSISAVVSSPPSRFFSRISMAWITFISTRPAVRETPAGRRWAAVRRAWSPPRVLRRRGRG